MKRKEINPAEEKGEFLRKKKSSSMIQKKAKRNFWKKEGLFDIKVTNLEVKTTKGDRFHGLTQKKKGGKGYQS